MWQVTDQRVFSLLLALGPFSCTSSRTLFHPESFKLCIWHKSDYHLVELTNTLVTDFNSNFVLVDTEWIVHIATSSFFHVVFMKEFPETSQLTSEIWFYTEVYLSLPGSFCVYLNRPFKRWKREGVSAATSLVCTASKVRYHLLLMLFLCETMKWR